MEILFYGLIRNGNSCGVFTIINIVICLLGVAIFIVQNAEGLRRMVELDRINIK